MHSYTKLLTSGVLLAAAIPSAHAGLFRHKKYENPISKDTLQPDKVLFDRAINDIVHGRYEVARLTLNTLINTYDSSEYLAKAKLAIADSWYREGGAHGLAQAEAEYKDFELFYPNMAESSEAQWRVCQIHYKQMEKVDRDSSQALRAEDECMAMVQTYPNSRYVKEATQMLRNVQEVLADKEFRAGDFYFQRGAFPAAQNRLAFVTQQFPLFSGADDALWMEAESFRKMGDRFEDRQADALTKIVRDYPLSDHVDDAKKLLTEMKKPIPAADPAAYERMKYDMEATQKPSLWARSSDFIKRGPDTHLAAKTGAPAMTMIAPPTPISVPAAPTGESGTGGGVGGTNDVTANVVGNSSAIDTQPEARAGAAAATPSGTAAAPTTPGTTPAPAAATTTNAPPPTNHPRIETKKMKKMKKKQLDQMQKQQQQAAGAKTPSVSTPEASGAAATMTSGTPAASGSANTATPSANPPQ